MALQRGLVQLQSLLEALRGLELNVGTATHRAIGVHRNRSALYVATGRKMHHDVLPCGAWVKVANEGTACARGRVDVRHAGVAANSAERWLGVWRGGRWGRGGGATVLSSGLWGRRGRGDGLRGHGEVLRIEVVKGRLLLHIYI